ncbi:hypothetical protein FGO68_gene13653 [Halteria grandinella]|uniref:Uncharacterized protein n=1 Tax=Halteria grandinella TaxID=5974 RepID=A0A8J8T0X2_HALGN|nr:hypothetical protein FGO68_gene13653 [Halteria grandinella]
MFIYLLFECIFDDEVDDTDKVFWAMVSWYKILHIIISSAAIIFDFITLGQSISLVDGRAQTHIIYLSISILIPLVQFVLMYCSKLYSDFKKRQEEILRAIQDRKLKPIPVNILNSGQQDQEDYYPLLIVSDEEEDDKVR